MPDLPSAALALTSDDDPAKEGLEFRKDGTVTIWIEGEAHRLRRPKLGEFRDLSDSVQDKVDIINDAVGALKALEAEMKGDGPDDREATPDEIARIRKESRALGVLRERLSGEWWVEAMTLLGKDETITVPDLPSWTGDVDDTILLLAHWRSVPSLSGVR